MDKDELHQRLMILKEEIESRKIKVPSLEIIESLKKVRYGTDGKVDPATVDSSVRALAGAVMLIRQHNELKTIPLIDVQRAYFDILDKYFSHPFAEMTEHKANPHLVASQMAAQPNIVEAFKADAPAFADGIREFWEANAPVVRAHLEDTHVLKAVFGGDIFPSYTANIASSVGLYIDTIILPDPLLRISTLFNIMNSKDAFYYLVKHSLNALQYKGLALAEVDPPIVCIVPDRFALYDYPANYLRVTGMSDLIVHCSKTFGRDFEDEKQLDDFLDTLQNPDDVVKSLADPNRLLFDVEWKDKTIAEQLKHHFEDVESQFIPTIGSRPLGTVIKDIIFGRMSQINDVLSESQQYSGLPLIDAPTSWQYFLWKYEYDCTRSNALNPNLKSTLITHALHAGSTPELHLLARIPPSALIDLRKQGAMEDLRRILSKGLEDVSSADDKSFSEVVQSVGANVDNAFKEHEKHLANLATQKYKFFGFDVGPWIVIGGISIAAASTQNIPLGILAASLHMLAKPSSPKELWANWNTLLKTKDEIIRSPVGILFRAK